MSDPRRLLGGYATDTLTEAERRELLLAALDDQELFDAVLQEDGLRELLEAPGAREQVLSTLEQPTRWERLRAWLQRPATFADLAVLAATLVIGVVGYRIFLGYEPHEGGRAAAARSAVVVAPATLARLLALPPHEAVPAGLELQGGTAEKISRVTPGETLVLRATLRGPAQILVVAERPDGSALQVFPAAGEPPVVVAAPREGGPAVRLLSVRAASIPGRHRLRLVVAPADVDLRASATADVDRVADRLSLVDLTYEVTTP
jgi:hypothetical protein